MKRFSMLSFSAAFSCLLVMHVSDADAEGVLHSFGGSGDGAIPIAGVIDVKNALYGTTWYGGADNDGTVFVVNPKTGAEKVLHSFGGSGDGVWPRSGLIDVNGTLYGTTYEGGASNYGVIFSLNPKSGAEKVLRSFGGAGDGLNPEAGLIDVNGTLYGTTYVGGGDCNGGSVYSFNPKTGKEAVLHGFGCNADGAFPAASLIEVKGVLYGTTDGGGTNCTCGTVFALNPKTGKETVLHSFGGDTDGKDPVASLIDVNGKLYGTTSLGGAAGDGAVFSIDPGTGTEMVVYSFCSQQSCVDGEYPNANLIDVKGTLYGPAGAGGTYGFGAIFSIDPATGAEVTVYSFCSLQNCADGQGPFGGLIDAKGTVYGTTKYGGTAGIDNGGTVFSFKP